MKGLEERFDVMEGQQKNSERQTSVHLQKIQQRFVQFESRLNDSKHKVEERIEEFENRINQQCSRPCDKQSLSTTPTTGIGIHHTMSPGPSIAPPAGGEWILIQKHNFLDKDAFKDKLWVDYKDGFGNGINEFWFGLQRMHDFTKNGLWLLKVAFTYDLNNLGKPLLLENRYDRGERAYGIYTHFHIDSEEKRFTFHVQKQIEGENLGGVWIKSDPVEDTSSLEFYTKDKDLKMNDLYLASRYGGGWWFESTDGFRFCANCQRDLVIKKKAPWEISLANCIWQPWKSVGHSPSEISMFMQRVN